MTSSSASDVKTIARHPPAAASEAALTRPSVSSAVSLQCMQFPNSLLSSLWNPTTGKSMSEALIFASTNPQYDNRLFIELPVQYMKIPSLEHVVYTNWFFVFVSIFKTIYVHNRF